MLAIDNSVHCDDYVQHKSTGFFNDTDFKDIQLCNVRDPIFVEKRVLVTIKLLPL